MSTSGEPGVAGQKPATSRISRLSRLMELIRQNGGRITLAKSSDMDLVASPPTMPSKCSLHSGDGLGKWYRGRSTPRGGRRGLAFILNPKAKEPPCYSHVSSDFEAAVRLTVMGADELRVLAWDSRSAPPRASSLQSVGFCQIGGENARPIPQKPAYRYLHSVKQRKVQLRFARKSALGSAGHPLQRPPARQALRLHALQSPSA
jgi:hypothetical protein